MRCLRPRLSCSLRARCGPLLGLAWLAAGTAWAASPQDAQGLWRSADQRAVIAFAPCKEQPTHLCGTIVWDQDAGTPADTCGVVISQAARTKFGASSAAGRTAFGASGGSSPKRLCTA